MNAMAPGGGMTDGLPLDTKGVRFFLRRHAERLRTNGYIV